MWVEMNSLRPRFPQQIFYRSTRFFVYLFILFFKNVWTRQPQLTWNSTCPRQAWPWTQRSSRLYLPSAEIRGVCLCVCVWPRPAWAVWLCFCSGCDLGLHSGRILRCDLFESMKAALAKACSRFCAVVWFLGQGKYNGPLPKPSIGINLVYFDHKTQFFNFSV